MTHWPMTHWPMTHWDAIIVGAGAAGLMCAATAGAHGTRVLLLEHTAKLAEKIRISGGGRCNFTNLNSTPAHFLSQNPHFCKSAMSRYTPHDFLDLVTRHKIPWTEKAAGQLFAQNSAQDIIQMLLTECQRAQVHLQTQTSVSALDHRDGMFVLELDHNGEHSTAQAPALVIATGGKSIPKIGATGWGYGVADRFGLDLLPTRAGLVPLTFSGELLAHMKPLSGISLAEISIDTNGMHFRDAALFTHRGLSGPAVLQISSYWQDDTPVRLNLLPDQDMLKMLKQARTDRSKQTLRTLLKTVLPDRLADSLIAEADGNKRLTDCANSLFTTVARRVNDWQITPTGTEGYRTAEVTLGGVDTRGLSSKTMEARTVPGLYFIGEVVDVTGHLGGHNFQWAWASAHAAGTALGTRAS